MRKIDEGLCTCVYSGDLDGVRAALAAKADPNMMYERSPLLHWAAMRGFPQIVNCLLTSGADLEQPDECGMTALMFMAVAARSMEQLDALDRLIAAGGNMSAIHTAMGGNAADMATVISNAPALARLRSSGGKCSTHALTALADKLLATRSPSRT